MCSLTLAKPPLLPSIPWLARENARLISRLRALSDADWRKPTFCPAWDARQLVGHMTGGAISYLERIQATQQGDVILSLGAETPEEFQAARDAIMKKSAAMSSADRIDWLERSQDALQNALARLTPGDLDRPLWHRKGDTRLRSFPDQRLYEVALHCWDLKNHSAAPLHADALGALVDVLRTRLPLQCNRAAAAGIEGTFRFETTAPKAAWEMTIADGEASPSARLCEAPDASLSASASDMVLLCAGRACRAAKMASGDLLVQGDARGAARLMDVLFQPF